MVVVVCFFGKLRVPAVLPSLSPMWLLSVSRVDHSFKEAFGAITSKTFLEQAKWFLNGFYEEMEPNAEFIWKCVQSMNTISKNKAKGSELDEFEAHRFLEHLGETLTVAEMRERLREIDVDFNRQVKCGLYHLCLFLCVCLCVFVCLHLFGCVVSLTNDWQSCIHPALSFINAGGHD